MWGQDQGRGSRLHHVGGYQAPLQEARLWVGGGQNWVSVAGHIRNEMKCKQPTDFGLP